VGGRRLSRWLRAAGFVDVGVETHTLLYTSMDAPGQGAVEVCADLAVAQGRITPHSASAGSARLAGAIERASTSHR
jgi:hypothetical protein